MTILSLSLILTTNHNYMTTNDHLILQGKIIGLLLLAALFHAPIIILLLPIVCIIDGLYLLIKRREDLKNSILNIVLLVIMQGVSIFLITNTTLYMFGDVCRTPRASQAAVLLSRLGFGVGGADCGTPAVPTVPSY